jgi:RHS repeat-associated protein
VRKDVSGSPSTEYLYFNGNVIAERNVSTGDWTDYVWAHGKRMVKAMALDNGLRIYGTRCGSCGAQYSLFYLSVGPLAGYAIRTGDKLDLTQYQLTGSHGGIVLIFSDGTTTNWNLTDQDGYFSNDDGTQNTTHVRRMDLGAFAGKTIQQIALNQENDTAAGSFAIIYEQAVVTSSDGTVQPIYTGESTSPVSSIFATSGVTGTASHIDVNEGKGIYPTSTTTYYHTNQINSSTLVTAGSGWPVWQATYLPYGEEYNPEIGTEHFKFTGKERDTETLLDYFGARYYSNTSGRFMTPDTGVDQHPIDPQSWNLYAYARNNPLRFIDPSGNYLCGRGMTDQQCDDFEDQLNSAQKEANKLKEMYGANSTQYKDTQRAIDAFGAQGVDNGVTVNIGQTVNNSPAMTTADNGSPKTRDNPTGQNIQVTLRPGLLGSSDPTTTMAIGHEGSHVADAEDWAKAGFTAAATPSHYTTEFRAYGVTSALGDAFGFKILSGTRNGVSHVFWMKSATEAGNDVFRSIFIKAAYPDWQQDAFQANTQGGGH